MEIRRLAARPGPDLFTRIPAANAGEPIACTRCSATFDTDPTIAVACPTCGALEGERCRLPPQGGFHRSHYTRAHIALRSGRMSACGALTWDRLHALPVRLPAPSRPAVMADHASR
ncbi:hypothetical protein D9599_15290 [Roseomonas sp. KE2513]|uniref:hypothetical protein n=1 Tax=Roseomonas sp. KE2513 TaxID=2479202 RepID=UPI0018DFF0FF|nr:hypothetical protein [Roseomonas sp. KE2513]MBI0536935.1 hypothetical protein [Roseomonas sp. KE2513]